MKKTESKKSRDTVPLTRANFFFTVIKGNEVTVTFFLTVLCVNKEFVGPL